MENGSVVGGENGHSADGRHRRREARFGAYLCILIFNLLKNDTFHTMVIIY